MSFAAGSMSILVVFDGERLLINMFFFSRRCDCDCFLIAASVCLSAIKLISRYAFLVYSDYLLRCSEIRARGLFLSASYYEACT